MTRSLLFLTSIGLCLSTFIGCGGSENSYEGPQRAAVSGAVTFEGKPIEMGSIRFIPIDSTMRPVSGLIGQGTYSIEEGKGPNLGEYRVEILAMDVSESTGEDEDADIEEEYSDEEEMEGSENPQTENMIPRKYNYDSELTITIDSASVIKDFDL